MTSVISRPGKRLWSWTRAAIPALVRLCEATLRRWPDDVNAQYDLADAYVHNGHAERAIAFLAPLHCAEPEQLAYQYGILEALVALGRTEKDFDWGTPPRIYRVGPDGLAALQAAAAAAGSILHDGCCFDRTQVPVRRRA
jgi:hypothetical protein